MTRRPLNAVLRYLRRLTHAESGTAGDAELLERYVRHRDEAAFELLLWRHGTLVFNLCRRMLPREQDAEDAFQATFLAFVRNAGSLSRRGSVAAWLYKVAYRVALQARERARKTAAMEKPGAETRAISSASDPAWSDVRPILDEELNRLPERLRRPFVLCYLEGKSNEEAARELGCRLGTIYSRLSRGRAVLRQRLLRRGVTLSLAAVTAHAAEAAPAVSLMGRAARTALAFADPSTGVGVSPRVTALAEGVLRTMFVTKLKIAAVTLLLVGVLAGGVWTAALPARSVSEGAAPKPKDGDKKDAEPIAVKAVKPKPGGMMLIASRRGQVIASQVQQIGPLVPGTIKEVKVDIGDRVKEGDVLLRLDPRQLTMELKQAESALEMAQAEAQEAEARILIADAEVKAAEALHKVKAAEKEAAVEEQKASHNRAQRAREVLRRGNIGPDDAEEIFKKNKTAEAQVKATESAIEAAQAEVKIKQGKVLHAKAALKAARAATSSARAALEKAKVQLDFTKLTAAFDGVVTRRTVDPGNFVQPSDSRLLRPLLTVQRLDTVRIVVRVSGADVLLIKRGMPVELDMPGAPTRKYTVSRFSPSLDDSGEMTVEIDAANADNRLLPGMDVSVRMPLRETSKDALIVPTACLVGRTRGPMGSVDVFVIRDGKALRVPVTVDSSDKKYAAISKGIKASDVVIIPEKTKLSDGTPVKVEKTP